MPRCSITAVLRVLQQPCPVPLPEGRGCRPCTGATHTIPARAARPLQPCLVKVAGSERARRAVRVLGQPAFALPKGAEERGAEEHLARQRGRHALRSVAWGGERGAPVSLLISVAPHQQVRTTTAVGPQVRPL